MRILALMLSFSLIAACGETPSNAGDTDPPAEQVDAAPDQPEDDPLAPGPWTTESGFRCVRSTSTIQFADDTTPPQVFVVTLGFPDRGRAELTVEVDGQRLRRLHYRFGGHAWFVKIREKEGRILEGAARDDVHRLFALRRALLMWPDHPAWLIDGHIGHAPLGELGSLQVVVNDAGLPTTMSSQDAAGVVYESLENIQWTEAERPWPRSFDLRVKGTPVWSEVVDRVETHHSLVDGFFQPAEVRRATSGGYESIQVQHQDTVVQRIALAKGVSWESAVVMGRLKAEQVESQGTALQSGFEIELGAAWEPVALVLLRDAGSDAPIEAPWVLRAGSGGRGASFDGPAAIVPAILREMASEIRTAGGTPGAPRVRFAHRELGPVQVTVPTQK